MVSCRSCEQTMALFQTFRNATVRGPDSYYSEESGSATIVFGFGHREMDLLLVSYEISPRAIADNYM